MMWFFCRERSGCLYSRDKSDQQTHEAASEVRPIRHDSSNV